MGKVNFPAMRIWLLVVCGALALPGALSAIEHRIELLLDLDNDLSTGCLVTTSGGPFAGVEQKLVTTVETTGPSSATVVAVDREVCAGAVFGPPIPVDASMWPVGVGLGLDGFDAVETYLPLAAIGPEARVIRIGVVQTNELGDEAVLLEQGDGSPILLDLRSVLEIPTLSEWGLIFLAGLLGLAALHLLGRRGAVALSAMFLVLAAGVAWATVGPPDGDPSEFGGGTLLAENPVATDDGIAIRALFGFGTSTNLCFRIDVSQSDNTSPTADSQAVATPEETPVAITLTGSDPESDPLTFAIATGPASGSLSGAPPNVTYTPDPDFEGDDTFTFTVDDGVVTSPPATVTITVTGVNDQPVVDPAAFAVSEGAPVGTAVGTATFSDPDADQNHTFTITAGNTGGAFAIDPTTGDITVAAALDFETLAAYALTVQVTDDGAPVLSGSATVAITVTDADDAPVAVDDAATVTEDDPATAIAVLANDTDVDGGPISVASVTQPAGGTVVVTGGGTGLTYQPDPDFCTDPPGTTPDTFTYALAPGGSTATVSVTVTCTDDDPVAVDDVATVTEDDPATAIDVLANDTDIDGGAISVTSVTQPAGGTVGITGGGTGLTYQPDPDFCTDPPGTTPDTFTYTLTPGGSTATVSVTVVCEDDAPTAVADAATVAEDSGANAIDVLANDTDIDGGPQSVASVTQPANGSVSVTGGGTGLSYTPNANYCNTPPGTTLDTFTYTMTPGGSSTTVTVTVTCVDDAPVASPDAATVAEDSGANAIDVLANDVDMDGGPLSVVAVQSPTTAGGTVALTGGGSGVAYQPPANYCNTPPGTTSDTFTYTVNGGSMATVSVAVTCVDDGPVVDLDADDDKGTAGNDFAVTFTEGDPATLLQDPDDPQGATLTDIDSATLATLTVTITNLLDVGVETLSADTTGTSVVASYVPATGVLTLTGPDTLANFETVLRTVRYENTALAPDETARIVHFVANDGTTDGNTAISTVTVVAVDTPPTAVADSATVAEDSGSNAIDVLANDTDPDGGAISITAVTQPAGGTVAITGGGTGVSYTPDANYCNDGTPVDTFAYTLTPGGSVGTVSVTVTCADDSPVAVADAATVAEDSGATAIAVLANDTDPDGGPISVTSVTQPANGSVAITGGGTGLTYTPSANYCNTPPGTTLDTFTYTLTPGGSSTTVTVTVTCVDDSPVAVADAASVVEDSGSNAIDVLANDTDVDGGSISIASVTQPAGGAVVVSGGGTGVAYTPNANYCNTPPGTTLDTFTYTLTPGGSSTTVTVTVTCVDDPPTAVADAATVDEDSGANTIAVQANDTDVDGGTNTITAVTQPANGSVAIINGGADLAYTPNANFCNNPPGSPAETFTYTLSPGGSVASVSVLVNCINDPPVAGTDVFETFGNTELRVDLAAGATPHVPIDLTGTPGVLNNDSDPVEGSAISLTGVVGCADVAAPFDCPTVNGGQVVLEADGSFSYRPPQADPASLASTAADSFQYTIADAEGAPATGTVSFTRREVVWYVDPTAAPGGDGRSHAPFQSFAGLNGAGGAGDLDNADDVILVHDGSFNGSIELEAGQRLVGQGVGLSLPLGGLGTFELLAAGAHPQVSSAAGDVVRVGSGIPARIAGLSLASTGGNAIDLTSTAALTGSGTLSITGNVLRGASAEGIDLNFNAGTTGTVAVEIAGNSWNLAGTHAGNAIDVSRTAGTVDLDLSGNTNLLSTGANALVVSSNALGSVRITDFSGNSVHGNTAGSGWVLSNVVFDAAPGGGFDLVAGGSATVGATGNGVGGSAVLFSNVAGDLLFTDLDVFADGGAGLSVGGTGAANVGGGTGLRFRVGAGVGTAVATGGPAVALSNLTADLQLASLTSTNTTSSGVSIDGLTDGGGTNAVFTAGSSSAITTAPGAAGPAFRVNGGNGRVAYAGTIVNNSSAARAVAITSWAGDDPTDDLVLSGAIDENGAGILVNGNGGARAITFSGGLDIDTTTGEGFAATSNTNALGLNVTGSANEIDSVSATGLRVTGTPIGSGNLTFRRISSGNNTAAADPANGIVVSNTGALGGLKITGTGGAGTGGTIQRTTGAGVLLTSTQHVSLNSMNVTNAGDDGIRGQGVHNLELIGSNLTNNGNATAENGLQFGEASGSVAGVTGTLTITDTNVTGSAGNNVHIRNTSGTLAAMNVSGGSFNDLNDVTGANSFLFEMSDTATTTAAAITGSEFLNNSPQRALEVQAHGGGTIGGFTVSGTSFNDNGIHVSFTQDGNANLTFSMLNNTTMLNANPLHAINIFSSSASTGGTITGTIQGNVIGNAGVANSGARGNGIRALIQGRTTAVLRIEGNTLRQIWDPASGGRGIDLQFLGPTAGGHPITQSDVTVRNNDVDTMAPASSFPLAAIYLAADDQGSPARVRADVTGNTAVNSVGGGSFDYPTFDGNGAHLVFVEVGGAAEGQLVDTAPASATATAQLTSTNTGTVFTQGITLIPGPINMP